MAAQQEPPPQKPTFQAAGEGAAKIAAESVTKKAAKKAVTKAAATKAGTAVVSKAAVAGAAAGSALGPVGTAVGGFVAEKLVNKKNAKRAIIGIGGVVSAPFVVAAAFLGVIFSSLGAGLVAAATTMVGAVIGVPILLIVIIFIINSGAYVVPPSDPLLYSGGDVGDTGGELAGKVECYEFDNSWSSVPNRQKLVVNAARHIMTRPNAKNLVCAGGTITVKYKPTGLLAGGISSPTRVIQIGPKGSSIQTGATYTLSHETGHLIDWGNSFVEAFYRDMGVSSEAYLPSYPLTYSILEDRVESLGLWMYLPEEHSKIVHYQMNYPKHYQFATAVFNH